VQEFEVGKNKFSPAECQARAQEFSRARFNQDFLNVVQAALQAKH
jgi:hypothetical protein